MLNKLQNIKYHPALLIYVFLFLLVFITAISASDEEEEKRGLVSDIISTADDIIDNTIGAIIGATEDDNNDENTDYCSTIDDSNTTTDDTTATATATATITTTAAITPPATPTYTINRKFELNISLATINPDCYNISYPALVINNQYPAPTLYAVKNDVIQVTVRNKASNTNQSSSIHFHGIRQYGTTFSDGVATITQVPISQGKEYIQAFQILNQSGTFYYHAHVNTQDDTIQGPLIIFETNEALLAATTATTATTANNNKMITESAYTYYAEHILQWSEYWHQSFYDRYDYYMGSKYTIDGGPDSFLLNGKSVYNSSAATADCKGFTTFNVEPNKVYRFRFIGALTFRVLGIIIPQHNMTLIEIDGEYVEPYDLKYLEIAAGQRMSVLIKTGNFPDGTLFPIASNYRWRNKGGDGYTNNGYGYLRYVTSSVAAAAAAAADPAANIVMDKPALSSLPPPLPNAIPGWVLNNVKPLNTANMTILNGASTRTIKLFMQQTVGLDNTTRFKNNNRDHIDWGNATSSLLDQLLSGSLGPATPLDPTDGFSVSHQTYPIRFGEIVDLVFQNVMNSAAICVIHPWHTHGHSHYLLAEGVGDYNHELDKDIRTFATPLLKDVSMTYPAVINGTANGGCGWTKVRIYTGNPGIWAVHCHITSHMLQGKMIILEVATDMIESTRRTFAS